MTSLSRRVKWAKCLSPTFLVGILIGYSLHRIVLRNRNFLSGSEINQTEEKTATTSIYMITTTVVKEEEEHTEENDSTFPENILVVVNVSPDHQDFDEDYLQSTLKHIVGNIFYLYLSKLNPYEIYLYIEEKVILEYNFIYVFNSFTVVSGVHFNDFAKSLPLRTELLIGKTVKGRKLCEPTAGLITSNDVAIKLKRIVEGCIRILQAHQIEDCIEYHIDLQCLDHVIENKTYTYLEFK